MKIILASPRGFCAGVNMAIETLQRAIQLFGTPIYVYHEIVHNKYVVDRFQAEGAIFVDDLSDVPEDAHLLYSAHGVAPEIRRISAERRELEIDALILQDFAKKATPPFEKWSLRRRARQAILPFEIEPQATQTALVS